MRRAPLLVCCVALAALVSAGSGRPAASPPLIGANYTHYKNADCSLANTGIVTHYQDPGIRRLVRAQLAAMHKAGVETLRLLLWHMTDATGQNWGIVPSGGGLLAEPYRSNLIRYLSDVRAAGFQQLTLVFGPQWTNWPLGGNYDPATFDENWQFIRTVVPLVKQYGPASTHIDLSNEVIGGQFDSPSVVATTETYVTKLWSNYVDTFGSHDATFSSIGGGGPQDAAARMQNLVDALRASGRPLPDYFDIHPPFTFDGTLAVLSAVDHTLTSNSLSQPLVVGEEAYNNLPVAQAIAQFMRPSSRPVLEVMEWPLEAGSACQNVSVSAPYRVDNYLTTLTGAPAPPATPKPLPLPPIPILHASVGPGRAISLRTASGQPVVNLDSGQCRIVVRDHSTRDDFHLRGPDVNRRTGRHFRGVVVWQVDIGGPVPYRSPYSFFSDRRRATLHGSFRIT
jgi:hypothetical protein